MQRNGFFYQAVGLLSGLIEAVMILCALYITLNVKFINEGSYKPEIYILVGLVSVVLFSLFSGYFKPCFKLNNKNLVEHIIHIFLIWLSAFCLSLFVISLVEDIESYSRTVLGVWFLLSLVFIVISHFSIYKIFHTCKKSKRIAIVGINHNSLEFSKNIVIYSDAEYKIVGFYDDDESNRQKLGIFAYLGAIDEILQDVRAGKVDEVYLAYPLEDGEKIKSAIKLLNDTAISVYWLPDVAISSEFLNRYANKIVDKSVVNLHDSPFKSSTAIIKRLEDIIFSSLILLFISPIMILIALGIKLSSSGSILFKQTRYGLYGEKIEVWKFRSMNSTDNGKHVPQVKKNDSRVTPFGAFLRRTSLDELPQFINVLQGQMSIVGPRPHAIAHNEEYRQLIEGYMLRHIVKPGITGWAQVNGWRGETDALYKMEKRVEFDLRYIREWSLWLDIKIIIITFFKGFFQKNAY